VHRRWSADSGTDARGFDPVDVHPHSKHNRLAGRETNHPLSHTQATRDFYPQAACNRRRHNPWERNVIVAQVSSRPPCSIEESMDRRTGIPSSITPWGRWLDQVPPVHDDIIIIGFIIIIGIVGREPSQTTVGVVDPWSFPPRSTSPPMGRWDGDSASFPPLRPSMLSQLLCRLCRQSHAEARSFHCQGAAV
jgi:hypothetical protein